MALHSAGLNVRNLTIRYGAATAVDGLTFEAPIGRLTGLMGPNGAGKTTTFDACCGLLPPAKGRVSFEGKDITSKGTAARARLGIGRTFQRMELFGSMTVAENVALGREAALGGFNPLRQLISTPKDRASIAQATEEALAVCGISHLREQPAGLLSTGQRRLVELARATAGDYRLLLLDEPSSGLDRGESERFGEVLRDLVETRGIGILLVEHDMALVMSICDHLYVLDFGQLIFSGTVSETQASPVVRAAYLGSVALENEEVGHVGH